MTVLNDDLDWNALWHEARRRKPWKSKRKEDWNQRAESFAKRTANSLYVDAFLELLAPEPQWNVLDVGCGPGTLALPLACRVASITCLDFSTAMLEILEQRMKEAGARNIDPRRLAWEDDWQQAGIQRHHVAMASRAMAVWDLQACLAKLNSMATDKIVVTDKVRHGPFDPDAVVAVGRPRESGPDYIYTINLLYQMGYLPEVQYIRLEETLDYTSYEDAWTSYLWMFRDLSTTEEQRLHAYLRSVTTQNDDHITLHRRQPPIWAFISWTP